MLGMPAKPESDARWKSVLQEHYSSHEVHQVCPAQLTGSDTFLGWRDTAVTAVFLGLSWCT